MSDTFDRNTLKYLKSLSEGKKPKYVFSHLQKIFEKIGWRIEKTTVFIPLVGLDGEKAVQRKLKHLLPQYTTIHYGLGKKDTWLALRFEGSDPQNALNAIKRETISVSGSIPSGIPREDELYITDFKFDKFSSTWDQKGYIFKAWLGGPGIRVKTDSGREVEIPYEIGSRGIPLDPEVNKIPTAFWAFVYKVGGLQQKTKELFDSFGQEASMAVLPKEQAKRFFSEKNEEIRRAFELMTEPKFQSVVQVWVDRWMGLLRKYEESPGDKLLLRNKEIVQVVNWVSGHDRSILSTPEVIFKKKAEETVRASQEEFISKSEMKVGKIVNKKKVSFTVKVTHESMAGNDFGGDVLIQFEDGDHFTMRTQTVWAQSKYGTPFTRFPTIFLNVQLGSLKKAKVSEEEMMSAFGVDLKHASQKKSAEGLTTMVSNSFFLHSPISKARFHQAMDKAAKFMGGVYFPRDMELWVSDPIDPRKTMIVLDINYMIWPEEDGLQIGFRAFPKGRYTPGSKFLYQKGVPLEDTQAVKSLYADFLKWMQTCGRAVQIRRGQILSHE